MSELSRETSGLLERGRHGESLGAADKARLKRAVLAQVAVASVVGTSSTAAAWTTVAAKVAAVVVVVSSVAGGTVALVSSRTHEPVTTTRVAAPVARPSPVKPTAPSPVAAPTAAIPSPYPSATPAAIDTHHAPPARPASREAISASEPSSSPIPAALPTSLDKETRLLRDADDALKAEDPERALRLLADLEARFPDSALTSERSAERVFALCMAGRKDEARDAARVFLSNESTGPLAARVRASCGGSAP